MAATSQRPLDLRAASLFDIDPELGELLEPRQVIEARARAVVAVLELAAGPWSPEPLHAMRSRPFALMVVEGLVVRELLLAGSTASELLGPGDIVEHDPPEDALLPAEPRWSVPETARVAVLDDRVLAIIHGWPAVGRVLLDRAARREARLSIHRAIAQLPRVDQRLLAFFGHLAERWGRVSSAGVVVPLQLTHEALGRLIGARRPTVSLALKDLATDAMLERRGDGSWLLRYEAFERLGSTSAIPPGWQPADARPIVDSDEGVAAPSTTRERARGVTAADIAALRARVDRLREQHSARLSQCVTALERSRATRRAIQSDRSGRDAA
jgi:CRP/FNR family transcriptional regulator, cyclic AMP receptor protein